jgi:hypothetical protein
MGSSSADVVAAQNAPGTPPTHNASPQRDGQFSQILYESEAISVIDNLFRRQLDRAAAERVAPNQSIQGDRDVKTAFWLLLGPKSQRSVFLAMCKRREFWPRIKPCIGSPPFSFLRPEDNSVLNAGGIALGRVNMASDTGIFSSEEIGGGQFADEYDRRYSWIADDNTSSTAIPVRRVCYAKRVVLDMKLPRMRIAERHEIVKRSRGKDAAVFYPRPGERIRLVPDAAFGGDRLSVTVRTVESKGFRSPVARLYCTV